MLERQQSYSKVWMKRQQSHLMIDELQKAKVWCWVELVLLVRDRNPCRWLILDLNGVQATGDTNDGRLELWCCPLLEQLGIDGSRHEHTLQIAAHLQQALQHPYTSQMPTLLVLATRITPASPGRTHIPLTQGRSRGRGEGGTPPPKPKKLL